MPQGGPIGPDPERRRVLDPDKTLSLLPIRPHHLVMDVGCGNGFFTFALARILNCGTLYAVDMQSQMLQDVRERVTREQIGNIRVVLSEESHIGLPEKSLDGVFSAFMLHETEDPPGFLRLLKGLLKPGGWLALLEWHKKETESGPPVADRIDERDCLRLLKGAGFKVVSRPRLNDDHYAFIALRPQ